jgi:chromosome partition protein MukB
MMVVLDAWERRESLGRGKEQRASLRFLFLDEASRLSVDVLRTLFELCDRLELQMLVAAPEVPLSEGNITWRLERVAGKVLVTGRKVEA